MDTRKIDSSSDSRIDGQFDRGATTIVVGAGLAGLTAANLLADAGQQVTVLEARRRLGGRATTDERQGHLFNQGPHALYLGGAGITVLRSLGLEPEGGVPPTTGALGVLADRLELLPGDAGSLLRTHLLSPADKVESARVLARLGRLDPTTLGGQGAEKWVEASAGRPRVRQLLRALARLTTYCADLDLLSAEVAVGQIKLGLEGVLYADGGWQRLVDRLAARARSAGVTIETGVTVEAIDAEPPVPASDHPADHVISPPPIVVHTAAGPRSTRSVIVAGLSPAQTARLVGSAELSRRAEGAVPVTAASLDIGLRRLPRPDRRFAIGIDRPLYFSVHNPPADLGSGVTLHLMRYLDRHDAPGPDIRAELESLLDQIQPSWRTELVASRFQRHLTVAHAVPTAVGAEGQGGYLAATPALADTPGVFVAGDWVGPTGHLADAGMASARRAAELALSLAAAAPIPAGR